MDDKQTTDELNMSIFSSRWNRSVNILIVALISQNTKFILAFKYLAEFFYRPFCLNYSWLTKKVSFPLNSSNEALIVFSPCAN